jgi:cytosine/uracil/thiamine/allantoin permease
MHILSEAPKLQRGSTPFWTLFPAALTANVGYWATLSLNIPDFTRYAQSQRSQALGQALGPSGDDDRICVPRSRGHERDDRHLR